MPSKQLIEKQNQLVAVQEKVDGIFQQAKVEGSDEIDLSKVKKIGEEDISGKSYTTVQIAEEIRKMNQEMEDLGKDLDSLQAVEKARKKQRRPQGSSEGRKGESAAAAERRPGRPTQAHEPG